MKKIIIMLLCAVIMFSVSACGETYQCHRCDKKTTKAYYDIDGDIDDVMCAECAEKYWAPHNYKNYKVK